MRSLVSRTAGILALAASAQVQAAQTQNAVNCLQPAEMHGLVAYFLPTVLDSTVKTCSAHLPADAFLRTKASQLVTTLSAGKDAAWPMAKTAFIKISGRGQGDAVLEKMPEEVLRPFIEAAMTAEVAPSIKAKDCKDVDRIAATLEPLPSDNLVALVTEILNVAARGDRKIASCPAA